MSNRRQKMLLKFKEAIEQSASRKLVKSFSDSCQKDVGVLRSLIGSFSDSCQKKKSSKNSSNHRYEVHPIGGELEETHHGYTCSHCTRYLFTLNMLTRYCCPLKSLNVLRIIANKLN